MKRLTSLAILVLLVSSLSGCSLFKKKSTSADLEKPPINEPVNVIDVSVRPFVTLTPNSAGNQLTFAIDTLPKSATELEYELEYQAGTLLQSTFGSIDLTKDQPPTSIDTLLGSCSAGGTCSYHQDVTGGTLLMKFRADENYVLRSDWRFIETKAADGLFGSKDAKLQIDAGKSLDSASVVIIMDTSGLPAAAPGELIAGPYGIFTPNDLPDAQVELSMRLGQDLPQAKLYGWDGSDWQPIETEVVDKTATATTKLYPVFIAAN